MTADEILAVITGQFDVTSATALQWLNEKHREAVAESRWRMEIVALATTVAGTAAYNVADSIIDVEGLYIDSGEGPAHYTRTGVRQLWELKSGRSVLRGSGGVFAPAYTSGGVKQVELYKAPTVSGQTISALAAVEPDELAAGAGASPIIPSDLQSGLIAGALALGFLREDERPDLAGSQDQIFQAMVQTLRRRRNSRIGNGPQRIKVAGIDF